MSGAVRDLRGAVVVWLLPALRFSEVESKHGSKPLKCCSPSARPEANEAAFAGACGEPISSHGCELDEGLLISEALFAWLDIAVVRL